MEFQALPYSYDALEPHLDAQTMEIHHSKHHKTYYDKFMDAVQNTAFVGKSLNEVFSGISSASPAIRNNAGGFYNHNFFWQCLSPQGGGTPTGNLADAINAEFGSYDGLKETMTNAAIGRFGSGFVWLVKNNNGKLEVGATPYQDNPLMSDAPIQGTPIMAIDVWEHAYYLKYQNRRPDYLKAFWNVVNWDFAATQF